MSSDLGQQFRDAWNQTIVDLYARRQQSQSPELFDDAGQAKWVTIGGERGPDGHRHGGHPVKIDSDGKMLTGAFAGKTLGEALGGKKTEENSKATQKVATLPTRAITHNEKTKKAISQLLATEERMRRRPANRYDIDKSFEARQVLFDHGWSSQDIEDHTQKRFDFSEQPATVKPRHESLLEQAEIYRHPGENYNRNIAVPANRLHEAIAKGYKPDSGHVGILSDELEMRLKHHGNPDENDNREAQKHLQEMLQSGKSLVQYAGEKNLSPRQRKALFNAFDAHNEAKRQEQQQPSPARAAAMQKFLDREKQSSKAETLVNQAVQANKLGVQQRQADDDWLKTSVAKEAQARESLYENQARRGPNPEAKAELQRFYDENNVPLNRRLKEFRTPSAGIVADTRANESAKPGDQMGLFGDVTNVPKPKAALDKAGETKGQQMAMFDTKGDPDQMMMFDDGVTPEDRLMPEAKKAFEPTLLGKPSALDGTQKPARPWMKGAETITGKEAGALHHGTNEGVDFDEFDESKMEGGNRGNAIYLTSSDKAARYFGGLKDEAKRLAAGNFMPHKTPYNPAILQFKLADDAKVLRVPSMPHGAAASRMMEEAREDGYHAIQFEDDVLKHATGPLADRVTFTDSDGKEPRTTVVLDKSKLSRVRGGERENISAKQMTNEQVEQMQEPGFEGEPDEQPGHPGVSERKAAKERVAKKRADRLAAMPADATSALNEIGKTFEQSAIKPESESKDPKKDDNGLDFAPGVSYSTIPLSAGIAAHRGTSFVPEKRGMQRQKDFAHAMNSHYADLKQSAKGDEQKLKQLNDEWSRFVQSAKSKYLEALQADSRTMSAMIAGPANFPTRSNRKKLDSAMNKWSEYSDFVDRATKAIRRDLHPENAPKKIGDKDTGTHLETKVAELQKRQDQMKAVNAIVRKHVDFTKTGHWSGDVVYKEGKSHESLSQEIQEKVGLPKSEADALAKRDPYGNHIGHAPYELANNNANLRRYKDQLERQKKFEAEAKAAESAGDSATTHDFEGGKLHLDYAENRIRIAHDAKPSPEVIAKLKSKGFRWSPANKAWQRQLTNAAKYDAHVITGVPYEKLTPKAENSESYSCSEDPLSLPDEPIRDLYQLVEHYWNEAQHPRNPSGSPVGGQFRSTKVRDLPHLAMNAPRISASHQFHHSKLPPELQQAALNWSAKLHELVGNPMNTKYHESVMAQNGTPLTPEQVQQEKERRWKQVDKKQVRELLDQMNSMDKTARAHGIDLAAHVNASKLIPQDLAERLSGGSRFFDPSKLPPVQAEESSDQQATGDRPRTWKDNPEVMKAFLARKGILPSSGQRIQEPEMAGMPKSAMMPKAIPGTVVKNTNRPNHIINQNLADHINGEKKAVYPSLLDQPASSQPQQPQPAAPSQPIKPTRNYTAGMNRATIQFESPLHQRLYDIGSNLRPETGRNPRRGMADMQGAIENAAKQLGISHDEVKAYARDVHDHTKEQMKGVQDGETRAVKLMERAPYRSPQDLQKDHALSAQAAGQVDRVAADTIGDGDQVKIEHFKGLIMDAWKQARDEAQEHNQALRTLQGLMGGGTFAAQLSQHLARGNDVATVKGFDEAVDHARRNFPHLVGGADDAESGVVDMMREGIREVPQPWRDEVVDRAVQMAPPGFFDEYVPSAAQSTADDDETVPFSVVEDCRRFVQCYWLHGLKDYYAGKSQMGLFEDIDATKVDSSRSRGSGWRPGLDNGNGRWRIHGISRDITTCQRCFRTGLERTIIVELMDDNGNGTGEKFYLGSECASKVTGSDSQKITRDAIDKSYREEMARKKAQKELHTFQDLVDFYAGKTQMSFDWDEAAHPRESVAHDGKKPGEFAPKASQSKPKREVPQGYVEQPRAKAGGEVSDVDGKFYKGGALMPVHGLFSGQEKLPPKVKKLEGMPAVVKANEEGKGVKAVRERSKEQIKEDRERIEAQKMWNEMLTGPIGEMYWMGDYPNSKAFGRSDPGHSKWAPIAERLGSDGVDAFIDFCKQFVADRIRKETESNPRAKYDNYRIVGEESPDESIERHREHTEWTAENSQHFHTKKHLKKVPNSRRGELWLSEAIEHAKSVKDKLEINRALADIISDEAKDKYAIRHHPMHAAAPTEAQKEAGNYRMSHIKLHGLEITIETPKGRKRNPEWPTMKAHYGYIRSYCPKLGESLAHSAVAQINKFGGLSNYADFLVSPKNISITNAAIKSAIGRFDAKLFKSFIECACADSETLRDLLSGNSGFKESHRSLEVPLNLSLEINLTQNLDKTLSYHGRAASDGGGNSPVAKSRVSHPDSTVDVYASSVEISSVLSSSNWKKVFWPVVESVVIDVMNVVTGRKLDASGGLKNIAMFANAFSVDLHDPIFVTVLASRLSLLTLPFALTLSVAKGVLDIDEPRLDTIKRSAAKITGGHFENLRSASEKKHNIPLGADGDHVDVFVGPDRESTNVWVVDQVKPSGQFDEHKCLIGFRSREAAIAAYRGSYSIGWRVGPVTEMSIEKFKRWLASGKTDKCLSTIDRYQFSPEEHPRGQPNNAGQFVKKVHPILRLKRGNDEYHDLPVEQVIDKSMLGHKVDVLPNGHVRFTWSGSGLAKHELGGVIGSAVSEHFNKIAKQQMEQKYGAGGFWRGTNNRNEGKLITSGQIRPSMNHADQTTESGLSTTDHLGYVGMMGYKHAHRLTGAVVGTGSDGEPLLDPKTIKLQKSFTGKALQDLLAEDQDSFSNALKSHGWTRKHVEAARSPRLMDASEFQNHIVDS